MTKKDIEDIIKTICTDDEDFEKPCISPMYLRKELEALALEQEPCEDYISRKTVFDMCKKEIDHISKNWQNYHSPSEAKSGFVYISTNIYDFPPVTPQPKTGHWQKISADKYSEHVAYYFRCSECGKDIIGEHNYCPNCGCRMKGVDG